jgi:hypothetical protein
MGVESSYETFLPTYQTTGDHKPHELEVYIYRCEKLKCQTDTSINNAAPCCCVRRILLKIYFNIIFRIYA